MGWGRALPFVVRSVESGGLIGMTRLKNLVREHRRATVGSWMWRPAWGTGANTEAKLLLLEHGFEVLQCVRIEFHTDRRNARSRAALIKLGAVEEGTLRAYALQEAGRRRDTVMYSVIDKEWPRVKRRLMVGEGCSGAEELGGGGEVLHSRLCGMRSRFVLRP